MSRPTIATLRARIAYDERSGLMTWLPRGQPKWDGRWAGKVVGSKNARGYIVASFHPHGPIALHRVAWALHAGEWAAEGLLIDHIDGDPTNNAISNLRLATPAENSRNRRTNSEFKGVRQTKSGRYRAHITLGVFDTAEEAAAAYDEAALLFHGKFASLNLPEDQD